MSDWREIHIDQNQRMAAMMLKQQGEINRLKAENLVLRGLVEDLRDPEPCSYNHDRHCQEHNWFRAERCADARAAELAPPR